ncbi:MAG: hypothetical protein Q9O62_01740 [Ardenticatenia bacterium]|nr:hypothetical protein [Ardenticatenia bacterium]
MVETAGELTERLNTLKAQRRAREIDNRMYYAELLKLTSSLMESLIDEVDRMDDSIIRLQVPLILVFLEDQIAKFDERS